MRVAIFSEGRSDSAVLTNILKGVLNIDESDIKYEVPELDFDETDLQNSKVEKFAGWSVVKNHCEDLVKIRTFLDATDNENRFIIIQIDSAEREDKNYNVLEPKKSKKYVEYSQQLRENIKNKKINWLQGNFIDKIAFAICIEEIDAWLITQFNDYKHDTSKENKPKEYFKSNWHLIHKKKDINTLKNLLAFEEYYQHSKSFRKAKNIQKYRLKNKSLDLFCEDLEQFAL